MYAIIETGGKQYRVQPGEIIQIEKLEGDKGASVKFSEVLMTSKPGTESSSITLGKPYLKGASVEGEIVGQGRGEKVLIIKMKRRKQYRRTQGHRQNLTQVLVTSVDNGSGAKLSLSAEDKAKVLNKFISQLTPKGPARTAKTLGSRKRLAAKAKAAGAQKADAAAPKAPAKKKPAAKKKAE